MKKGFTLIELLVSVAIFSVVMVIAMGALLSISAAERKAETLKTVMDNLNLSMESMTRSIRTGYNYHCGIGGSGPQDCSSGQSYLTLTAVDGSTIAYCLNGGVIRRQTVIGSASTNCSDTTVFLAMTAPEIVVNNLTFYVKGAPLADSTQPKVTITLTGYVNVSGTASSTFTLQTSVTQRIYDQ
jgi:prepilin-type N-terminal cleavage/methylation domain-containing protein